MVRYKHIDTSPRFLAVNLQRQLLPGTFEHALNHVLEREIDLSNHMALAKVFRAKLLAAIAAAGLPLPARYPVKWVADCTAVGSGQPALNYLGRYLYRGVIAEKAIVAFDHGQVTFRYRDAKSGKWEPRTVAGAHFLWLVLQRVLPKGFRRARNFDFLHPNCKPLIAFAPAAEIHPEPGPGRDQKTRTGTLPVLRGSDDHHQNATAAAVLRTADERTCRPRRALTMCATRTVAGNGRSAPTSCGAGLPRSGA